MITEFGLENFKAFAAMQSIPIKPITLIYGANSSGKSSIIQAWLMLKQTIEEKRDGTNDLLSSGTLVDLGNFREFVNSHDQSRHVAIQLKFGEDKEAGAIRRRRLIDLLKGSAYFPPENLEEVLDFPEEIAIGVNLLVASKEKPGKTTLCKIEIHFLSKEPLLVYRIENSDNKVAMILEKINEEHYFLRQLWEKNKEKLDGLIYTEINASLNDLGYNLPARSREEISENLRIFLEEKNREIIEENTKEIKLREIELEESHSVESLRSQRENIEKERTNLEKEGINLDQGIKKIMSFLIAFIPISYLGPIFLKYLLDYAYILGKLSGCYSRREEIEITKSELEQELESLKEPLSNKELRLGEIKLLKSSQSSLDRLESELEEINSLLEFWNSTDRIDFPSYLRLLKNSFNDIFNLDFHGFSPRFYDNSSKSLNNYYLAKVFEQLNASISLLHGITSICFEDLEDTLINTNYLGPLREAPKRYYEARQSTGRDFDKHGSLAIEKLYNDQIGDSSLIGMVNKYFKELGLKYTIGVRTIGRNDSENLDMQSLYAVRLIENDSNCDVNIANVGFGISQILPIIVQSVASTNSIILIEQPELHIHPKLQTKLGQLFADCIQAPLNNHFVIETHSEHILRRIQKLIRHKVIRHNDVSLIFVDRDQYGSKCLNLRLSQNGNLLDRFPQGFFDEDYKERL